VRVLINGQARELPVGVTLAAAVAELHGAPEGRGVAAALNGEVIPRREWPDTELAEGAVVELVVAVQGG
jgi:sulfur carrier protein